MCASQMQKVVLRCHDLAKDSYHRNEVKIKPAKVVRIHAKSVSSNNKQDNERTQPSKAFQTRPKGYVLAPSLSIERENSASVRHKLLRLLQRRNATAASKEVSSSARRQRHVNHQSLSIRRLLQSGQQQAEAKGVEGDNARDVPQNSDESSHVQAWQSNRLKDQVGVLSSGRKLYCGQQPRQLPHLRVETRQPLRML
jgi:hypothetical protein